MAIVRDVLVAVCLITGAAFILAEATLALYKHLNFHFWAIAPVAGVASYLWARYVVCRLIKRASS